MDFDPGLSRRITLFQFVLLEIVVKQIQESLPLLLFYLFAPFVLGVRGPSSSVCLSYEVPVLNPAGSSRVSPVRSDLPFEGFSSQRDPGIPRSRWGILFLFFEGFLQLGTLLVNFQNQFVFPYLPFLPGLLF